MTTPNPTWASKLASRLRSGNFGVELQSEDGDARGGQEKVIRVQKTWATETTTPVDIELQDRSPEGSARAASDI